MPERSSVSCRQAPRSEAYLNSPSETWALSTHPESPASSIQIASHTGGRDSSGPQQAERNHFRGAPFSFRLFSLGRARENGQTTSNIHFQRYSSQSTYLQRSFFCLDTKERTKEKIKAGEKTAKNFFAELKRIKCVLSSKRTGGEYSFLNTPLCNFLDAVFSQAGQKIVAQQGFRCEPNKGLGGLRHSFAGIISARTMTRREKKIYEEN